MSHFQADSYGEMVSVNKEWPVRWDLLLRYRLIEIISFWEGRLTTNHLIDAFGIGRQQASRDINAYIREFAPDNLVYDAKLKGYKPGAKFRPVFTKGVADEYLQVLATQQDLASTFASLQPSIFLTETLTPPLRDLRPEVLAPITQAAREKKRVEICYSSLRNPKPEYRMIQPHTVIFNGHRWHVRAFCEQKMIYSDFVLSRISDKPELTLVGDNTAEKDEAWQTIVELDICPDPRLNTAQKALIARDYGMTDGVLKISTRGALVAYILQNMRLEGKLASTPPEVQQIFLQNRTKIKKWLFGQN
jgi:predicted DNA-binding transcriptional regulator YafY